VIEMLSKLFDKFSDERYSMEKEEANSKHAFEMLMQDLSAQISTATDTMNAKKEDKANNQQGAAEKRGDLADTTSTRDDDQAYLDDLVATCQSKSSDFEARQQLRAEEIEAIEKAIEIMSGNAVSGHAGTYLPKLMQTSFVQLAGTAESPMQKRAVAFLSERAEKIHSRVLSALVQQAANDPFQKVRKMINNLIMRLQEEANEEAEHKGWCDKELATNEQTRKEKTEAVENLHATIDELEASIAKLTKQVADLTQAVAELDSAVAEATEIRNKEKKTNAQTVADAQEAQSAVASALQVLKNFYQKAGKATALVQEPADAPEIFDKAYTGMQSENGGVLGMLEVIQSDFARLETETKTAEATNQNAHDKFLTTSAVDKASKNKDIEHKTNKKINDANSLTETKDDLASTQKELDAALKYYDKLKPSCVNAGVSYEDRVARRKEEIESLQEALKILNGEDLS
jgi:chromosome segregation ATPase